MPQDLWPIFQGIFQERPNLGGPSFKDGGNPFSNQPRFGQNLVYYVIIVKKYVLFYFFNFLIAISPKINQLILISDVVVIIYTSNNSSNVDGTVA